MLHRVLSWMYDRPMWLYWGLIGAMAVLWGILGYRYRGRRFWICANTVISMVVFAAVVGITLVLRNTGEQGLVLSPTALFESAKIYPDVYIQMQLNAVLFVPLGLTLPYGLFVKTKHPVVWTVLTATLFSVGIEIGQYVFSKGYSEWMDVVLNVSGAVLGITAYALTCVLAKYCQKKEDHDS